MKRKIIGYMGIFSIVVGLCFFSVEREEKKSEANQLYMDNKFKEFQQTINETMKNPIGQEEVFLKKAEEENDPLTKGTYYSITGILHGVSGDIEGKKKYSELALQQFKSVHQAEQFTLDEYISLARLSENW